MICPDCTDTDLVDVPAPFGKGTYLYCRKCKRELVEITAALCSKNSALVEVEYVPTYIPVHSGPSLPVPAWWTGFKAWTLGAKKTCEQQLYGSERHVFPLATTDPTDRCQCGKYSLSDLPPRP